MNILRKYSFLFFVITCAMGFEFDHNSCGSLLPNHQEMSGSDSNIHQPHHRRRRSFDDDREDEVLYELTPETTESPFKLEVSAKEYRRSRLLQVIIRGSDFNGFILQARSQNKSIQGPVGVFKSAPASATLFNCYVNSDTVINKDSGGKANLEFTWQAPLDDNNQIYFIATVVQKDKFWANVQSHVVIFNPFPPTLDDCGQTKSCYSQSSINDCLPDKCDYVVIAQTTEDNEIEFIIGGTVTEEDGYIAIGFTMDNIKMTHMDITACIKNDGDVEIQQFLVADWNNGPRHYHKISEGEVVDKDGDTIWCQYKRPLHGPGPHMADLTQSLFHTFLTGSVNRTTTDLILPPLESVNFVSEVWNHRNSIAVMHLVGHNAANIFRLTTVWLVVLVGSSWVASLY